jgi:hypothetical protein
VVGPVATRFREYYLGSSAERPGEEESPAADGIEIIYERREPRAPDALPRIWLPAGTRLHAAPEAGSTVVGNLTVMTNLGWRERSGDWYRVERRATDPSRDLEGWAFVDDPTLSLPTLPPTVEPAVPLAATPISPQLLAQARSLMAAGYEGRCGPYGLLTDVAAGELGSLCAEVVQPVDAAYARRYGLRPLGEPAETVLIFSHETAFKAFAGRTSRWRIEAAGRASAAHGYVALQWEDRERRGLEATLVHELAHLVNRRALGPALPPWLDEGVADDLADHLVGGKYEPAAWQLGMDRAGDGALPMKEFLRLDRAGFYGDRGFSNYAQAMLTVRFLSGHPQLAGRFAAFLDSLAAGGTYSPDVLGRDLEVSWTELQRSWDHWVVSNYLEYRPIPRAAGDSSERAKSDLPRP